MSKIAIANLIIGGTETPEQKKLRELFESLKNIRWR